MEEVDDIPVDLSLDEQMERPGTPEQDVALVLSSFPEAAVEVGLVLEDRKQA